MPRGRPKNLSNYEKVKAKKIRDFLSSQNVNHFDKMNDSTLLKTVRISDDKIFISLDYYNSSITEISKFVSDFIKS
jgi:hypothetical protein